MILQIKLAISPLFGENFSEFVQFIIQTALNAAIVFFVSKFLQNVWDKFVDSYKSAKKKTNFICLLIEFAILYMSTRGAYEQVI